MVLGKRRSSLGVGVERALNYAFSPMISLAVWMFFPADFLSFEIR
jgi:hypothetical protein